MPSIFLPIITPSPFPGPFTACYLLSTSAVNRQCPVIQVAFPATGDVPTDLHPNQLTICQDSCSSTRTVTCICPVILQKLPKQQMLHRWGFSAGLRWGWEDQYHSCVCPVTCTDGWQIKRRKLNLWPFLNGWGIIEAFCPTAISQEGSLTDLMRLEIKKIKWTPIFVLVQLPKYVTFMK